MNRSVQVLQTINSARVTTDGLFDRIRPDSLYARPVPERHRFIFYMGHLEAFDWNLICRNTLEIASPHAELDQLFAFGIDPGPGQLPQDEPKEWPSVEEVRRYNRDVRHGLDQLLPTVPEQILHVALEHRLMHVETLSYILHNLEPERKALPRLTLQTSATEPKHAMILIPEGIATLGRAPAEGFRWDNECESHAVKVPPFLVSKYKVTNRQYLEFVGQGGPVPHYWIQHGERWLWRGMCGEIPLPLDWPVYVSHEQAQAYARWSGKSLPTEAQFHRAAYATPGGEERLYPWGDEPPTDRHGHFDCQGWDPIPVNATPLGDSAFGISQLVGNGWEWTCTPFHPFDGFKTVPFYPGYSERFFDGDHFVLKGGSSQTAVPLLRRSFRNWFRGGYPYGYAGFRYVQR